MSVSEKPSILYCPMGRPFTPCDVTELAPIVEHLKSNQSATQELAFRRGTHLEDGRLDLCKQRIGPVGAEVVVEAAKENIHFNHLLLGANGLGDQGARAVASLARENSRLQTIYLGCNAIESEGAIALADALWENQQVTGLWLKRNPIGPAGAIRIAEMLRTNTSIRTLDLVHTKIEEQGLEALVNVLANPTMPTKRIQSQSHPQHDATSEPASDASLASGNTSVRRLYLGGNAFGPNQARLLARLVRGNRTIHSLFLSVNRLGDEGVRILAEGVRENSTLHTLGLSSNRIGRKGAWHLADALQNHPSLQVLDLGYDKSTPVIGEMANCIGDMGCTAISDLLQANQTLRSLDLSRNGITSSGASVLWETLHNNKVLTSLHLGKGVGKHLKRQILAHLASNAARQHETTTPDQQDIQAIRSVYRA